MKKIWKTLKNTRGKYLISNYGDIYSKRFKRNLKHFPNRHGTEYVCLYIDKQINRAVHKLVLQHFKKKERFKDYGLHVDYNRKNNKYNNLKWSTLGDLKRYYYVQKNKVRGVYRYNIGNKNYRVMIKFKNKVKTIGYYKTKNEAIISYVNNYEKFYGIKPFNLGER